MRYKVVRTTEGKFSVVEVESAVTVDIKKSKSKAEEIANKINNGHGFDGWTPPFFAIQYEMN